VFENDRINHPNDFVVFIIRCLHERHGDDSFVCTDLRSGETDSSVFWIFDVFYHVFCEHDGLFELIWTHWRADSAENFICSAGLYAEFARHVTIKKTIRLILILWIFS